MLKIFDVLKRFQRSPLAAPSPLAEGALRQAAKDADLLDAIAAHDAAAVKSALQAGANVNARDRFGDSAIHVAFGLAVGSQIGRDVVELLIISGADLNLKMTNSLGPSAFERMVRFDSHFAMVALEHGQSANAQFESGQTAIFLSASLGDGEATKAYLAVGADPNWRDACQRTPLHVAATPEIVDVLLGSGASLNALSEGGGSPLTAAIAARRADVCRRLLERGAPANALNPADISPLRCAVDRSTADSEIVSDLCEFGADLEECAFGGKNILATAAFHGHTEVVRILAARGAHLEARDGEKRTPLLVAGWRGHDQTVLALLGAGADITAQDVEGVTLHDQARDWPAVQAALNAWKANAAIRAVGASQRRSLLT